MKRMRSVFGLMAVCMLVLAMTADPYLAAVYDATGVSGQAVPAGEDAAETVLLYPGDSVFNTDVFCQGEQLPLDLHDDGETYEWKNNSGTVYRILAHTETIEVEDAEEEWVPLMDEDGNPVLDPETQEPVYVESTPDDGGTEEFYTWYELVPWGGTVEVINGSPDTPSDAGYSMPSDTVYSYVDSDGNSVQASPEAVNAAAYTQGSQVNLVAGDSGDGRVFRRWAVYTVDGNSLSAVSDDMLGADPSLIPGLSADMLSANPLPLQVSCFRSRVVFVPLYAAAEPMQEEAPAEDLTQGGENPVTDLTQGGENPAADLSQENQGQDSTVLIDPETGYQIDPDTGYIYDPETGFLYDPNTGYLIDSTAQNQNPEEVSIINNAQDDILNIVSSDEYGTQPQLEPQNEEIPQQPVYSLSLAYASCDPAVDVNALAEGTEITVTAAGREEEGLEFDRWIAEGIELNEEQAVQPVISIRMPAANAALAAQYKEKVQTETITVSNATIENVESSVNEDGTVSATVEDGTVVTVSAAPAPEGQQFQSWNVVSAQGEAVMTSSTTDPTLQVTVSASDVTVEPVYTTAAVFPTIQTIVQPENTGTITLASEWDDTDQPTKGYTFNLEPVPGYQIDSFTVAGSALVGEPALSEDRKSLTFHVQAATDPVMTVTASLSLAPHTLTVNSGSGSGTYHIGDEVAITASEPEKGWRFTGWTVSGGGTIKDAASSSTTFTMADIDAVVTANYEQVSFKLTVKSGSGSGTHHVGDEVVIKADAPKTGYRFHSWNLTSGEGTIASTTSKQTTFTMAASDAVVTAKYELIPYSLTVKNGSGSGSYTMGTEVDVTPNFPASGKEFDRWEKSSGSISFDDTGDYYATVTMNASDAVVTALYKDGPNPNNNTISGLENGAEYLKSTTLTFSAAGAGMDNNHPNPGDYRYRPSSYQIGSVGGSWTSSPYTTSMAINATGDYTLTVTYAKDIYDGSSWNADGTSVTKSITFHVVNALSVQTGDRSPLIPLAIAGGAALIVIIVLVVVVLKRRGKR